MHMQDDFPLLMSTLYDHGVRYFPESEIVSKEHDHSIVRTTYGATDHRIRRLATALRERLGVERGDAVGTFAWNNRRHHELYWATANTGTVCHTLNIRLYAEQLIYIINHAKDKAVFVDPDLVPLFHAITDKLETVEHYIVLGEDGSDLLPGAIPYEELIDGVDEHGHWPELDERSPLMYCYTSGTTGNPKGVAYTQRSTYLHTISNLANFAVTSSDTVLPVVPMFHAAAWGYTFEAVPVGARLVYPGPDLTPHGLVPLLAEEKVTFSAGVPTVWLGIQHYLMDHPEVDLSSIRAFLCGGSAVPRGLIDWFWKNRGIKIVQGWGMTETNPIASVALLKPEMESDWTWDEQLDVLESAGRPVMGLKVKIVDEAGEELPHDGEAFGELLIRGPWIAAEYYNDPRTPQSFVDGWLRTGDVCKITPDGYIRITDRAKDVIKSGGEWISSLDLENALMAHPSVAEATVVGLKHEKWQERPAAFVVARPGTDVTEAELLDHLRHHVAKWWLPDKIVFIEEIPKTGTGKFDKKVVRDQYSDLLMD
ncbi:MAG: long-chain fatty acid--CoA ligase [Acidimicrobiia bacterium]|nr:long-chain fatty acid--CoA ligase [Acidimicrobiia bacterium]